MSNDIRPYILVTNDDGIGSPGLLAVAEALQPICDLLIVAPITQQTNMGRGSQSGPGIGSIIERKIGLNGQHVTGYAIKGSPAQAVAHGVLELADRLPDYCISGINYGENVGLALTCSGTLGACFEADSFGIPGIAFSRSIPLKDQRSDDFEAISWEVEKVFVRKVLERVLDGGMPYRARILNVNFPSTLAPDTEVVYTSQASMNYGKYIQPTMRDMVEAYQLGWELNDKIYDADLGTDIHTLHKLGKVSITPISPIMSII